MARTPPEEDRRPGEFELISRYFAPLASKVPGALGLGDDAALLTPLPGTELVLTTDVLIESVHFLRDDPPDTIARKALRVNLSDLAAKGAQPAGYLLVLALAPWAGTEWIERFAYGLGADQNRYGIGLLGGDTAATPGPLSVAITAIGTVPAGAMLKRSGAKPGDIVFVSGTIGDAGAGLDILRGRAAGGETVRSALIARYRLPEPRLSLGRALRGRASAALDVSDGLLGDLGHIAEVSGVAIVVEASCLPLSTELVRFYGESMETRSTAATAGDDYEIAFTAPASSAAEIEAAAAESGTPVTAIGRVEAGQGVRLLDAAGVQIPVRRAGYTHF